MDKEEIIMETKNESYRFTQETIDCIAELGKVYQEINKRLLSDGYEIKNGRIKGAKCLKITKKK